MMLRQGRFMFIKSVIEVVQHYFSLFRTYIKLSLPRGSWLAHDDTGNKVCESYDLSPFQTGYDSVTITVTRECFKRRSLWGTVNEHRCVYRVDGQYYVGTLISKVDHRYFPDLVRSMGDDDLFPYYAALAAYIETSVAFS